MKGRVLDKDTTSWEMLCTSIFRGWKTWRTSGKNTLEVGPQNKGNSENQTKAFRFYLVGRKSHWKFLHKEIKVGFRNTYVLQFV